VEFKIYKKQLGLTKVKGLSKLRGDQLLEQERTPKSITLKRLKNNSLMQNLIKIPISSLLTSYLILGMLPSIYAQNKFTALYRDGRGDSIYVFHEGDGKFIFHEPYNDRDKEWLNIGLTKSELSTSDTIQVSKMDSTIQYLNKGRILQIKKSDILYSAGRAILGLSLLSIYYDKDLVFENSSKLKIAGKEFTCNVYTQTIIIRAEGYSLYQKRIIYIDSSYLFLPVQVIAINYNTNVFDLKNIIAVSTCKLEKIYEY
jgi:hypothetical protein